MKKILSMAILVALTVFSLTFSPVEADGDVIGKYKVRGTMNNGLEYTGEVTIFKAKRSTGIRYYARGRLVLADGGEQIARFYRRAKWDGKNFTFVFNLSKVNGILDLISNMGGRLPRSRYIKVDAKYAKADENTLKGGFKARKYEFAGQGTWSKQGTKIEVTGAAPAKIESGTDQEITVVIRGVNFPDKADLKPEDIQFPVDGRVDGKIVVKEIREVADNGSSITVTVTVAKDTPTGKRDVVVKKAVGEALIAVEKGAVKMPLGGGADVAPTDTVRVFIPQKGGFIKIDAPVKVIHQGSADGTKVEKGTDGTFQVEKGGWYYINLAAMQAEIAITRISNTYNVTAETPKENKPWNFWYFPFYDRSSNGQNLYDDGGGYEKLDKLWGIKADEDGWMKFKPYNHIDKRVEDDRIQKLAEKYYKGYKWEKPEDEKDLEYLKKHNPTSMKGYAYAYQRSTDSDKSWWGHCWGSVVASSLWSQPKGKTVEGPDGEKIRFSEEEIEGFLTSYYTNHSIFPTNYMRDCPAGPAKEEKNERVDRFCDDFFLGLIEGIGEKGLPLASNLRASSRDEKKASQVWNHVIWKYDAKMTEAEGGDHTVVKVELTVYATDDIYPSGEGKSRIEKFTFILKYNENGSIDRDNMEYQNWISSTHFCPSYLWRIQRSAESNGTENALLRGKIDRLVKDFDYKRIK